MRRNFSFRYPGIAILLAIASLIPTCTTRESAEAVQYRLAKQVVLRWNGLMLDLERYTVGYRPPVSARTFAYVEMAGYEAAVPAMPGYHSLESIIDSFDQTAVAPEIFCLPEALNQAYACSLRKFFRTAPDAFFSRITELEEELSIKAAKLTDPATLAMSAEFGRRTADAVWQYSLSDNAGHDGFLYNYDPEFKSFDFPGCWKKDAKTMLPPLLPNWGKTRPFVVRAGNVEFKPPIRFDESRLSAFFSEAAEVYSISQTLSNEEKWISEFWSDDVPGLTVSPTGRWISITNQAMATSSLPFSRVMETYFKAAVALCDASIICWAEKYKYQLERPETYIKRNISSEWEPLHVSPPFPSYPSGHACFGAAVAEVLTEAFGDRFELTDNTHKDRREFYGKPRHFESFRKMAEENAYSRLLIGVHFRMDCEEGMRLGSEIGEQVNNWSLMREQSALMTRKNQ